jgi:glycosyltransferase involved in cell wall biosynthesis
LINELDLSKSIEYVEYVEHSKIFTYLNSTDALFLAIPEAKNNEGILTGKLFEYLAARKPILCIGPPNGDAAAIISECDAGKTFNRNDEELILNYLQLLIDNHLNNKQLVFNNLNYMNYSRKNLTKQLTELF